MSFLPKDLPKVPENYLKLTEGVHTFRVVSDPIVGFEYWNRSGKPVRLTEYPESFPSDMDPESQVMPFWAFVIWNPDLKAVQILQVKQKTVMGPLKALFDNPKWGDPREYDITITRKGSTKTDTEYSVTPNPKEPLSEDVKAKVAARKIELSALMSGEDPFASEASKDVPF